MLRALTLRKDRSGRIGGATEYARIRTGGTQRGQSLGQINIGDFTAMASHNLATPWQSLAMDWVFIFLLAIRPLPHAVPVSFLVHIVAFSTDPSELGPFQYGQLAYTSLVSSDPSFTLAIIVVCIKVSYLTCSVLSHGIQRCCSELAMGRVPISSLTGLKSRCKQ